MNKIKLMAILVMAVVSNVLFIGCGDKNSNPTGPGSTVKTDTSIFIGTWADVFDTSDNPPGTKAQKLSYWRSGTNFSSPDTFKFSDSLWSNVDGFEFYYSYSTSKDSINFYSRLIGTTTYELQKQYSYYLSNDTLIYNKDSLNYTPVAIRISK
jgi:hypothetical protein